MNSIRRCLAWTIAVLVVVIVGAVAAKSSAATARSQDAEATARDQRVRLGSVRGAFTSHQRLQTRGATSQRDVVVYLQAEKPSSLPAPTEPALVVQERLRFEPHVLAIRRGSKVSFLNKDDVDHNVFSTESCCSMDFAMRPHTAKVVAFEEVGVPSIVCRLHPEMSLWVVVLRDPWFTQIELEKQKQDEGSAYSGEFRIVDVPPGDYTLTFWNKKLRSVEYKVTVAAGVETRFDIEIAE